MKELHPYLSDPERASAFEYLSQQGAGTTRRWAEQLGWKRGKLNRFLDSVRRYRLAEIETTPHGSRFRPCTGVAESIEPKRDQDADKVRPGRDQGATTLGSTGLSGFTGPSARERETGENSVDAAGDTVPWSSIAVRMIPAMNQEFMRMFSDYRPINPDNRGSHRAGHELERAGVEAEWCEQRLRQMCRMFNPSKHGGGEPPRSLRYYAASLIRDWSQYSLPLARVEPASPRAAAPERVDTTAAAQELPDPAPAADPTRWRLEIAADRTRLSRIAPEDVGRALRATGSGT
ncbi:MAG: hypothetical protein WEA80_01760 [Gemmatimonadaceae bacterium]